MEGAVPLGDGRNVSVITRSMFRTVLMFQAFPRNSILLPGEQ